MEADTTAHPNLHPALAGLGRREAITVVQPPGTGYGYWAGAPSVVVHEGEVWMAYRLRRPVDQGRGYANVVARSSDGLNFSVVSTVTSGQFNCASLERPALAVDREGIWRLYVSCSTEGSKHWWVECLRAADPADFAAVAGKTVLPGSEEVAYKDPVVSFSPRGWEMWACRHEILPPQDADRMTSSYLTSPDGDLWSMQGSALERREGHWDSRGARISAVLRLPGEDADWQAVYDGRASSDENWEERTGIALGSNPSHFVSVSPRPLVTDRSIRYLSVADRGVEGWTVYYEETVAPGTHALRAEKVPLPVSSSQSE